jgi:hypothetical protein
MDPSGTKEEPVKEPETVPFSQRPSYWWREPAAGFISVGLATFDVWHFGRDAGLTSSLDEILILTGIALIAGVKNLFSNTPPGK